MERDVLYMYILYKLSTCINGTHNVCNVCLITFSKFTGHTSPVVKEVSILPLDDINNEAIALFMYRYFHNMLPSSFNNFFTLNKDIHKYNTRSSSNVHTIQASTNCQKHSVKH